MTGSDHTRTISRIKNVAKINVSYGDLSARIYYLMSRFPVAVSITRDDTHLSDGLETLRYCAREIFAISVTARSALDTLC